MEHSQQALRQVEQQLLVSNTKCSELMDQLNIFKAQMEKSFTDAEESKLKFRSELASLTDQLVAAEEDGAKELQSMKNNMNHKDFQV